MKRFAFIGETPLKVFHSVNFVLNDEMGSRENSDIFVYGGFSKSFEIYKALEESDIFNHVYYFKDFVHKDSWYHRILTAMHAFFPRRVLRRSTLSKIDFSVHYDYIVYAVPYAFSMCILQGFRHDAAIGLEDGLSSYFGDVLYHYRSKSLLIFNRVFPKMKLIEPFERLYLSVPRFFHGSVNAPVYGFPKIEVNSAIGQQLFTILGYHRNSLYCEHKIVYLTQAYEQRELENEEKNCLKELKEVVGNDLIVRVHPRQTSEEKAAYRKGYCIDELDNIWELECLQQITDSHYLIGACSTAQIAPKLICDKEPNLVFLYKIFCKIKGDMGEYERGAKIVDSFRELYTHKGKIYEPNDFSELIGLLRVDIVSRGGGATRLLTIHRECPTVEQDIGCRWGVAA